MDDHKDTGSQRSPPVAGSPTTDARFGVTNWSLVAQAQSVGDASATHALDQLCRAYWAPIYAFIRRRGHRPADAQDLTQEFFTKLLQRQWLDQVQPQNGRFRTYLLACLVNFLNNEWDKRKTLKRGGQLTIVPIEYETEEGHFTHEPSLLVTPEKEFERRWVCALIDQVIESLRGEYAAVGRSELFERIKEFLPGNVESGSYAKVAAVLGLNEGAVKVSVHRMRRRFGESLRQQVAKTVTHPVDVEEEIRYLFSAWNSG